MFLEIFSNKAAPNGPAEWRTYNVLLHFFGFEPTMNYTFHWLIYKPWTICLSLQTEEFSDENKSIVWFLVKQVRPGMDLSRVVLPTFILEPRSFLEKISDYYYHADFISE